LSIIAISLLHEVKFIFKYLVICVLAVFAMVNSAHAQTKSDKIFNIIYSQTDGTFSVKILTPNANIDKIIVMNLIGRKMKEQQYQGQDIIYFTDIADMPSGIYVVILKDKNEKVLDSAKLILSK
jgi:hypothetical protein